MATADKDTLTDLEKEYNYTDEESVKTQELQPKKEQDNADAGRDESEVVEDEAAGEEEEVSGLSSELVQQAILTGLTEEEAGAFSSDADLQRTLNVMARANQQQGPPVQPAQQQQQPAPPDWKAPEIKLSDDDADPEVVKQFNEMNKSYADTISAMKNDMGTMANMILQGEQRDQLRRFDQHISQLPEATRKKLGSGPSDGMTPGQPGYNERGKVITMMEGLFQARPEISEGEAFSLATDVVLGKKRRRSAGIARPNAAARRSGALNDREETPDEKQADLIQAYKEMAADNG